MPEISFYNTGIATQIYMPSNHHYDTRLGKVQPIDAPEWYMPLRRNLGEKNCVFYKEHIGTICGLVVDPLETEKSKFLPNEALGYWKVTANRPRRLAST